MKRIFIWIAHPKADSLCESLAKSYGQGAISQGAETRIMRLCDMKFQMEFEGYTANMPELEEDLLQWQENLKWADHFLVVHPYWWAGMPAQAKAVFDRALTPGFAYKYKKSGKSWDKLLNGKTADAIITSDTPPWIDQLIYGNPGRRVIQNQVFKFCGMKPVHIRQFGSVKIHGKDKIPFWLEESRRMGQTIARSRGSFLERLNFAWMKQIAG